MLFAIYYCLGTFNASNTALMSLALPATLADMASALFMVATQMGNAIGVAALGSVLNGEYGSKMKSALVQLPDLSPQSAAAAQNSVGAANAIADQLPPGLGEPLRAAAQNSFMEGWQLMALVGSALAIIAAILVVKFLPLKSLPKSEETCGGSKEPLDKS